MGIIKNEKSKAYYYGDLSKPTVSENRLQVLSKEIFYDALKDYDTCILKLKLRNNTTLPQDVSGRVF